MRWHAPSGTHASWVEPLEVLIGKLLIFWTDSVTPIERLFALILFLPIAGLIDDAFGRYSGINWISGVDRLITEPALLESILLCLGRFSVTSDLFRRTCGYTEGDEYP